MLGNPFVKAGYLKEFMVDSGNRGAEQSAQ